MFALKNCLNEKKKIFKVRTIKFQCYDLIDNHLAVLCGISNEIPKKVFLGRITYGLMDEESRKLIQGFKMPEYDNLKRADCLAFGKEILNTVNNQ